MPRKSTHKKQKSRAVSNTYLVLLLGILLLLFFLLAAYVPHISYILTSYGAPNSNEIVPSPASQVKKITMLTDRGGRLDWSHANNLIAFDRKEADGYFDIFTMKADGSGEQCITCDNPALPNKHQGQPEWHPSGNWIVFQAEKAKHFGLSAAANPGIGVYNDIWIISRDKKSVYQLTNIPNNGDSGILHPHFSHDGKKLVWGEMYEKADRNASKKEFGVWKIKIADFTVTRGVPKLSNIKEYQPLGAVWYETHGFSPDDRTIYFTSNAYEKQPLQADIIAYNLATKRTTRLTQDGYNEHAQISPDGKKIVWMHTDRALSMVGTDYWIMNADGASKQQLTFFRKKGSADYNKDYVIAADSSWNAKGDTIAAYEQSSITGKKEYILLLQLK